MFVDSEVLAGPSGMAVYKDTIEKWDAPHENMKVMAPDRDRSLKNIQDAFRFQGFEVTMI